MSKLDVESQSIAELLFAKVGIFNGMTTSEVDEILQASTLQNFPVGATLFEEGDAAGSMFLIKAGEIEVRTQKGVDEDVVLAQLSAGAVVGELSILEGNSHRSATVRVLSDVQLYELSRESFVELRRVRNRAAYALILNLARILEERRRGVDERLNQLFENPAAHIGEFEDHVHEILKRTHKP